MRAASTRAVAGLSLGVVLSLLASPTAAQSPAPARTPEAAVRDPVVACPVTVPPIDAPTPSPDPDASPAATASIREAEVRPAPEAQPVGAWPGRWRRMPASPLGARSGAATDYAAWDGRIYVWGGRDASGALLSDGAAYVVADRTWVLLPDAGLVPRERFAFDSDGKGIVIWGGVDAAGAPLDDGARLTFEGRRQAPRWEVLPPAPLTPGPASIAGDLNGMWAVSPGASPGDPPRFAWYDQTDEGYGWDDPSSPDIQNHGAFTVPPVPPGIAYEMVSVRSAALLLSHQADGSAIGSWFDGAWGEPFRIALPASDGCAAMDLPAFAWVRAGADGSPVSLVQGWGDVGGWQALAPAPAEAVTDGMLVWAPRHLIVADALLAYDMVTDRWLRLPDLPGGPRTGVSAAWFDGRLYVWGGRSDDGTVHADGFVFRPDLPADTFRLPGGHRDGYGDCGGEGDPRDAVFRADPDDPDKVWLQQGGQRISTFWPDGYVVRFRKGRGTVIGPDGAVAAREGQRLRDAAKQDYCPSGDVTF
jgi:hypothetical protein